MIKSLRLLFAMLLASFAAASTANERNRFHQPEDFDLDAHMAKLASRPPELSLTRLPEGYKIGRCLLIVDGKTRISGRCAYWIERGGKVHIDGPRQIYDGIDYPKAEITAAMLSTDYWANVFKDGQKWTGYGNDNISSVHGEGDWGTLKRQGACFKNFRVTVCLWKK